MTHGLTLRQLALFWQKVDTHGPTVRPDLGPCWLWTGSVFTKSRYGQVCIAPRTRTVHRVAYEIAYGSIPPKHDIDHRCRTRHCVKPTHLRAATRKQNQENLRLDNPWSVSGIRGVHWDKTRQKWSAALTHNYRTINLGRYDTKEEAAAVVTEARKRIFTHSEMDNVGELA